MYMYMYNNTCIIMTKKPKNVVIISWVTTKLIMLCLVCFVTNKNLNAGVNFHITEIIIAKISVRLYRTSRHFLFLFFFSITQEFEYDADQYWWLFSFNREQL